MDSKPNEETYNDFAGLQINSEEKKKCYICDKKYLNEKNLQNHVRRLHEKAKSYECGRCKKTFTRMSNLNRHFGTIHGKTNFKCDLCGKTFNQKDNLKIHVSTIHQGKSHIIVKYANTDLLITHICKIILELFMSVKKSLNVTCVKRNSVGEII